MMLTDLFSTWRHSSWAWPNTSSRPHLTAVVEPIELQRRRLRSLTDRELSFFAAELRVRSHDSDWPTSSERALVVALAGEAVKRTLGMELYREQLFAADMMAQGWAVEMATGEGKTLAAMPAAVLHGLTGGGVHVVTANAYLASRDQALLAPAYELLGLTTAVLPDEGVPAAKRATYAADIVYATGYALGFDFLRDQLQQRPGLETSELGAQTLACLASHGESSSGRLQRGLHQALIDEVDHVLIDDAVSPLILSGAASGESPDAAAHYLARQIMLQLTPEVDYRWNPSANRWQLTPAGLQRAHGPEIPIPFVLLRRSWVDYLENALFAEKWLVRDVHYVVRAGQVQIVEEGTGRIFADRSWRDGLQQAIETKERIAVTADKEVLAQITRQRFFRLYRGLAGMSGTLAGCEREFQQIYRLPIAKVPLRTPSRRTVLPLRSFRDCAAKWQAIAAEVVQLHRSGRPVLVGTRSIADSQTLVELLVRCGLDPQVLNGCQDRAEADIVAQAGQQHAVTVATNLAGRGTDIRLGPGVAELGGLHVIVAEPHESVRVDRQLIGRAARQGDPGSAQSFLSADDRLIERCGPWLRTPMLRSADARGEIRVPLGPRVRRLQHQAEHAEYAGRAALMRHDLSRASLLSRLS